MAITKLPSLWDKPSKFATQGKYNYPYDWKNVRIFKPHNKFLYSTKYEIRGTTAVNGVLTPCIIQLFDKNWNLLYTEKSDVNGDYVLNQVREYEDYYILCIPLDDSVCAKVSKVVKSQPIDELPVIDLSNNLQYTADVFATLINNTVLYDDYVTSLYPINLFKFDNNVYDDEQTTTVASNGIGTTTVGTSLIPNSPVTPIVFDGTASVLTNVPAKSDTQSTTSFIFNLTSSSGYSTLLDDTLVGGMWIGFDSATNQFDVWFNNTNNYSKYIQFGKTYHVTITNSNGSLEVTINGESVYTVSGAPTVSSFGVIGQQDAGTSISSPFTGSYQHLIYWNRLLNPTEINDLYRKTELHVFYENFVNTLNPVYHWNLNDASGNHLEEYSGFNAVHNGTYTQSPSILTGQDSTTKSQYFDGTSYIATGKTNTDSTSTLSIIFRPTNVGGAGYQGLIDGDTSTVFIGLNSAKLALHDGANHAGLTTLVDNQTYHLVVTNTNGTFTAWLDNVVDVNPFASGASYLPNDNIGADESGTQNFTGYIEDISYWDRVLTDQEITDLFTATNI
jgi:hypothetical protein